MGAVMKVCKSCANWAELDADAKGQCRRGRPSKEGWPETSATDWCGEFFTGQPRNCRDCKYYIPNDHNYSMGVCFLLPPGQRDASASMKGSLHPCSMGVAREFKKEACG